MATVRVQADDFDVSAEIAALRARNPKVGAIACFVGTVRDLNEGEQIDALELEHYPGMTEKALAAIAEDAIARWPGIDVAIVHRVGKLYPLDQIVFVATVSAHRGDAFQSCEFVMDYLKTQAPFWKKEKTPHGRALGRRAQRRRRGARALGRRIGERAGKAFDVGGVEPTRFARVKGDAGRSRARRSRRGVPRALPIRAFRLRSCPYFHRPTRMR